MSLLFIYNSRVYNVLQPYIIRRMTANTFEGDEVNIVDNEEEAEDMKVCRNIYINSIYFYIYY